MKMLFTLLLAVIFQATAVLAAFGWTDDGDEYVIDSGANLIIKVNKW